MRKELDGFSDFIESKTGLVLAALLALVAVGRCWNIRQTDPSNFPDLSTRFRIERSVDVDQIHRLSVYRADSISINWYDDDLVALERVIQEECGPLSKFTGKPDEFSNVPVNFRILRSDQPLYGCSYLR